MSDQINRPADELSMGEQMKRKFAGLDPFIPPAVSFEQIEGAVRVDNGGTRLDAVRVRRGSATRFRANAGASLGLIGVAAAVVLVLGSGLLGPKGGVGTSASPSSVAASSPAGSPDGSPTRRPSAACSVAAPGPTAACALPLASSAASQAAAGATLSGAPVKIFSELGETSAWSPGGTRFAFTADVNNAQVKIVDTAGKTLDTVTARWLAWVDDDTYVGMTGNVGGAFVGRVGSAARTPIPGFYGSMFGGLVAAGGYVALPVQHIALAGSSSSDAAEEYVIWSAGGITAARSGHPVAMSSDGKLMAVTRRQSSQSPFSMEVVLTDSGDVVASYLDTAALPTRDPAIIGFSPDGARLAFLAGSNLVVINVAAGQQASVAPCDDAWMHPGAWLGNSRLLIHSVKCAAPADSGVTIVTTPRASPAVSLDGKIASAETKGTVLDPTTIVTIEDGRGGQETFEFKGVTMTGTMSWSADGSHLLIEYADFELANPSGSAPMRVVMIRV